MRLLDGPTNPERLPEPITLLDEAVRKLAEAAMSVTHHDIDSSEPEAIHEILAMERKFRPVLRRYATKKARRERDQKGAK